MPGRRGFLAGSFAFLAGCWKGANPSFPPVEEAKFRVATETRAAHLAILEKCRVPATATRTTPPPSDDILATVPQLKPLGKVAIRLHPRFGDEPAPSASKLGGRFLWPAGEPWPSAADGAPFLPILQLRLEDAPPGMPFPPGTDLLQLLWIPRTPIIVQTVWRSRKSVAEPLADPPPSTGVLLDLVPVPCRLFPERVMEFPSLSVLPKPVRDQLPDAKRYADLQSVCPGTKVGGYPLWPAAPKPTACEKCRWPMDFLLAISDSEWSDAGRARWRPREDTRDEPGFRNAAGLTLPDGVVNVFVCRRCEGWPTRAI